jgi:hypothetical protein
MGLCTLFNTAVSIAPQIPLRWEMLVFIPRTVAEFVSTVRAANHLASSNPLFLSDNYKVLLTIRKNLIYNCSKSHSQIGYISFATKLYVKLN